MFERRRVHALYRVTRRGAESSSEYRSGWHLTEAGHEGLTLRRRDEERAPQPGTGHQLGTGTTLSLHTRWFHIVSYLQSHTTRERVRAWLSLTPRLRESLRFNDGGEKHRLPDLSAEREFLPKAPYTPPNSSHRKNKGWSLSCNRTQMPKPLEQ